MTSVRINLTTVLILLSMSARPVPAQDSGLVDRFRLPSSPIEIRQPAKQGRFFDTMSRRAGILGAEGQGFEAWVYPLLLFHDCRFRVAVQGTDEILDLGSRTDLITVRPESVTLTSTHSLFTIRQIFFTPLDEPATVVLFDIDTARPLTLTVSFVPDLRPMWPAGLGGQYAAWSDERRLFILSESRRRYNGLAGCPAAVRGSNTPAHELGKGAVSFDIRVDPASARTHLYPLVIAGSQNGREAAYETYKSVLSRIPGEYNKLVLHYRALGEELLSVETPEKQLDLALEWAKVAFDRGFVDNPDLGAGLVAGWGLSGESARPGFGWFFGGDTYLNQYAISSYGAFDMMRQAFRFLQKRQRADGKMMHEMSQAAAWVRWFEDYPYGYYHGDTTPFYITSFHDYYRQSGDDALLRESWDSLKKAYAYCKSTDEDGDGLMDNTKAGLGASELGSLLEGLKTDVLLGALSPAAWRAMASMADIMQDHKIRGEAQNLFEMAVKSAGRQFWNSEMNSLVHAVTVSGAQNPELTAWPAIGIMLDIFTGRHADATAEKMASFSLATDWGVRMLASTSKAYDPVAYNNGAVWPFLTGLAAAAEFERHRAFPGYQLLLANARLTWAGALGSHPELLSGDYYRPLETAVPHQLFSSGGVVTPLVRGLLGLRGDAPASALRFSPHFPPGWNNLRIRHYRVGSHVLDIAYEKTQGKIRYTIEGASGLRLNFSPALGLNPAIQSVSVNRRPALFKLSSEGEQDVHCDVAIDLAGPTEVELKGDPGIEIDAPIPEPMPGDTSRNLRILNRSFEGSRLTAILEGLAGETYTVRVWTSRPIEEVRGGKLVPSEPKTVEISFDPAAQPGFVRKVLEVRFKSQ